MRWLVLLLVSATLARADGERAGDFDYYVLSLSWSPSWCALEGDARGAPQCAEGAGFGWVLHGLWPQYERGWPAHCPSRHGNPSRTETAAMADIMGSSGLAWYQWRKHGRCSGLSAGDYYRLSRLAFERIARPPVFRQLDRAVKLPAAVVEEAFLKDTPALSADMLTVTCKSGRIQEVRLCLTRALDPRPCAPDIRRDCTLSDALLDPVE